MGQSSAPSRMPPPNPTRLNARLLSPEGSQAMEAVNIRIGPLTFDHADYDADGDGDGDVVYLHVGQPQPGEGEETPEGHVLRFAPGHTGSLASPSSTRVRS